jgi:hypothetical protein
MGRKFIVVANIQRNDCGGVSANSDEGCSKGLQHTRCSSPSKEQRNCVSKLGICSGGYTAFRTPRHSA